MKKRIMWIIGISAVLVVFLLLILSGTLVLFDAQCKENCGCNSYNFLLPSSNIFCADSKILDPNFEQPKCLARYLKCRYEEGYYTFLSCFKSCKDSKENSDLTNQCILKCKEDYKQK